MKNILGLTIEEVNRSLQERDFSCRDLVEFSLDKIEKYDSRVKAFITICEEEALEKADKVDDKIKKRIQLKPLEGIPYTAKDVFCTKNIRTTAGSKILDNFIPPYDATVIKKLNEAGAILIGKTNCDAFGFGSSTENSGYFTTSNPYDISRVSGGSSGGSAAAVSMGMGCFSIAEDTGGSIRQPSAFCNVSGLKVTYGRVSRYGSIAYGSSLDTVGPISKNVADLAIILEQIAGIDKYDSTTVDVEVGKYPEVMKKSIGSVQVGLLKEFFENPGIDKELKKIILKAVDVLDDLGCHIEEVSLPHTKYSVASNYLTKVSEVSANLARYDGIRFGSVPQDVENLEELYEKTRAEGFEDEVKRRIMLGTYALSAGYYDNYYKKAMQIRTLMKKEFEDAFNRVGVILAPVSPTPPFQIGKHTNDPLSMWLEDVFTETVNPTGCPSLAIPAGFNKDKLPIGMQIIGPQYSEELLFRIGYHFQNATDYHNMIPPIIEKDMK